MLMHVKLLAIVLAMVAEADARQLDLSKPADIIRAEIRLDCSPDPAKPRLRWMSG